MSLRICDKINENFNNVDDFNIPIIIFLCGSDNSTFIDSHLVKNFVHCDQKIFKYSLKNTTKSELISAILWCKLSNNLDKIIEIGIFPNKKSKNKIMLKTLSSIKNFLSNSSPQLSSSYSAAR